jgi:beta-galactosidase
MLLNVGARLRHDTPWAPAGFLVAREQFVLKPTLFRPSFAGGSVRAERMEDGVIVKTERGSVTIDPTGALCSWISDGREMLRAPLEPYFWKPENDNQRAAHFAQRLAVWEAAAAKRVVKAVHLEEAEGFCRVSFEMSLPVGADLVLTYCIGGGDIRVEMDYRPVATDIPLIPKFGMRMRIPADYTRIRYYGRGPWENYPDRKLSAFLGVYEMPLADFETEYIRPQDNGNRCDVRWFEAASDGGKLRIEGLQPLCIRAWDYGEEDLATAAHPDELKRGDFVNLNIDLDIHGVGGTDTWGRRTLPQYTIDGNRPHAYGFILRAGDE